MVILDIHPFSIIIGPTYSIKVYIETPVRRSLGGGRIGRRMCSDYAEQKRPATTKIGGTLFGAERHIRRVIIRQSQNSSSSSLRDNVFIRTGTGLEPAPVPIAAILWTVLLQLYLVTARPNLTVVCGLCFYTHQMLRQWLGLRRAAVT